MEEIWDHLKIDREPLYLVAIFDTKSLPFKSNHLKENIKREKYGFSVSFDFFFKFS